MKVNIILIATILLISACQQNQNLPFLGTPQSIEGKEEPYQVPGFSFTNQDGKNVTEKDFENKIYIANFFFTKCTAICPTVMSNMVSMYDKYENNPNVKFVSFSLDPKKDSIQTLKQYSDNLEIKSPKWELLTGEKSLLHGLADDFLNIVIEDAEAPGGINHSGKIILIDKEKRIRSYAEGTDLGEVEKFIGDIDILLKEYEKKE